MSQQAKLFGQEHSKTLRSKILAGVNLVVFGFLNLIRYFCIRRPHALLPYYRHIFPLNIPHHHYDGSGLPCNREHATKQSGSQSQKINYEHDAKHWCVEGHIKVSQCLYSIILCLTSLPWRTVRFQIMWRGSLQHNADKSVKSDV